MNPAELARRIQRSDLEALWPTQSAPLLRELHLLTRDGKLNQDARRKLKQIHHFARLLLPALETAYGVKESPTIVDVGSGKSYLGFLLYDLWSGPLGRGRILSVESRADLVAKSRALAGETGFARMDFLEAAIRDADPETIDVLVALHACDTATDEAILLAARKDAAAIALVPCCQAEISRLLKGVPKSDFSFLWRHPLHSREFGSHYTNVLRTLVLECLGYSVTVTELTGWEHSLKNELILAEKARVPNPNARAWLDGLLRAIPAEPMLIRELRAAGRL